MIKLQRALKFGVCSAVVLWPGQRVTPLQVHIQGPRPRRGLGKLCPPDSVWP